MAKLTLYGIKNCDTVRKAKGWLDSHNISYDYHDFRANGITKTLIKQWLDSIGDEILVNRRGTTWRKLSDEQKAAHSKAALIELLLDQPAIIKRPVLDKDGELHVGFKEADYQALFGK